jgi:hypothetical protein
MGGPEPIAIAEILAYVNLMGIASQPERLKYLRLIQLLDLTYLAFMREKAAQNNNKSGQ